MAIIYWEKMIEEKTMLRRCIFFWTVSLLWLTIISCSTTNRAAKTGSYDFQEIETFLQSLIDTGGIPGIAIAITSGEDLVYSKGFGVTSTETKEKLEPQHIFHVASVSKTFTATAVMQLYEKSKIDINKTLVTYLPYFKLDDERYKLITIKQMLNHTSGMPDVEDYEWEKNVTDEGAAERYTKSLAGSVLLSEPGKEYHYSNMAFDIMADLVAKVSGKTFEKFVRDSIFSPLEMNKSSFYYPEIDTSIRTSPHTGNPAKVSPVYPYNRMHAPSSTLNTSAEELAHWAIANLNEGKYRGKSIIRAETFKQMMTPTFLTNKERNVSVCLSWFSYPYRGSTNMEHGGGDLGYRTMLNLIPDKKLGLLILCNYDDVEIYNIRNWIRDVLLDSIK